MVVIGTTSGPAKRLISTRLAAKNSPLWLLPQAAVDQSLQPNKIERLVRSVVLVGMALLDKNGTVG